MDKTDPTVDKANQIASQVHDLLPDLAVKMIRFMRDLPEDLTVAQAFLLHNLQSSGPCTASTIGEMMCVTSGPVTSLTKRLKSRGLLSRRRDERDGRIVWFSLTDEGAALAERIADHSRNRWAMVASELGLEKAEAALALIEDTIRVLNQMK